MSDPRRGERGVVLALVLVIGLLLTTAVVAFSRRQMVDTHVAHNRDAAAQADALARGGAEDTWYQQQSPPYRAANQPLRTVDELAMVEGFTPILVDGLRPYVTVHPREGGSGINLNTAPAHVLSLVYHGSLGSRTLASEDTVRRILRARQDGRILCSETASDDRCILASEIVDGSIFPEATLPGEASVFTVEAEATVGDIRRTIAAVVDRTQASDPRILEWRRR